MVVLVRNKNLLRYSPAHKSNCFPPNGASDFAIPLLKGYRYCYDLPMFLIPKECPTTPPQSATVSGAAHTSQHVPQVVEDDISFLRRLSTLAVVATRERFHIVLPMLFYFCLSVAGKSLLSYGLLFLKINIFQLWNDSIAMQNPCVGDFFRHLISEFYSLSQWRV